MKMTLNLPQSQPLPQAEMPLTDHMDHPYFHLLIHMHNSFRGFNSQNSQEKDQSPGSKRGGGRFCGLVIKIVIFLTQIFLVLIPHRALAELPSAEDKIAGMDRC